MKRTSSGIDSFEIRWQVFSIIEKQKENYVDIELVFEAEKPKSQSLADFFYAYKDSTFNIFPKYFINGINLTKWWAEDFKKGPYGEFDSGMINMMKVEVELDSRNYAWLKMLHHRMLGYLIDYDFLKSLNSYEEEDFEYMIEEENEDVQLYGCICGDRMCGYFPIQVIRNADFISWVFHADYSLRDFIFSYKEYENEFEELMTFARTRQKVK